MSDDAYKFRGPHVVCRALEASMRREITDLTKRLTKLEAVVRHVLKHDAIASGVPALDTSWIHQDGVDRLRHYGHRARKATWLYAHRVELPQLTWGPARWERLDEGFHSAAERRAARAAGAKPRPRLSTAENLASPLPFRDLLLGIVRNRGDRSAADVIEVMSKRQRAATPPPNSETLS